MKGTSCELGELGNPLWVNLASLVRLASLVKVVRLVRLVRVVRVQAADW